MFRNEDGEIIKWLGVLLYTPNMQPIPLALREQRPPCLQYYLDTVIDAAPGADPLTYSHCVPVVPQMFSGSCIFLRFPRHIKEVEGISLFAVILDLTTVGGHYFACVLPGPISYDDLIEYIEPQTSYHDDPLRLFIGDSPTQHPAGQQVELFDGVVIFGCRPVYRWRPQPSAEQVIADPSRWEPISSLFIPTPYRGTLVQYKQKQYFVPSHHHTGSTIVEAASDMFKLRPDEMTTCASSTPGLELQGRACSHILVVLDMAAGQLLRPLAVRRRDVFVLCDFRALGARVWLHHSHVFVFHLPSLAGLYGVNIPANSKLIVLEGDMRGDEVTIEGDSTLTFLPMRIDLEAGFEILPDFPDKPRGPDGDGTDEPDDKPYQGKGGTSLPPPGLAALHVGPNHIPGKDTLVSMIFAAIPPVTNRTRSTGLADSVHPVWSPCLPPSSASFRALVSGPSCAKGRIMVLDGLRGVTFNRQRKTAFNSQILRQIGHCSATPRLNCKTCKRQMQG